MIQQQQPVTCPGCGWEIDTEVCHCGISKEFHDPMEYGHNFVPAGCTCGYHDADKRKNHEYFNSRI